MRNLLYIIAFFLLIGWFVGVFVYSVSSLINVLFILAIVALILRLLFRKKDKRTTPE